MTRKEAVEVLKLYLFDEDEKIADDVKKFDEALRMAIEALSEPINCVKCEHYTETEDGDGVKGHCLKDGEEIIRDILKTIPTVYLLEDLGVGSVEELMEEAEKHQLSGETPTNTPTDQPNEKDGEWLTEYTEEEAEKEFPNIAKHNRQTDLISREDAIDAVQGWMGNQEHDYYLKRVEEDIESLPSADRQQGEWIEVEVFPEAYDIEGVKTWASKMQCDRCGFRHVAIEGHITQYNFCPNCGADMRGEL